MRIAHLSDPHILNLVGVAWHRWLNKRATGWVNLKLHRGSVHQRQVVETMMDDIRSAALDHVVITGDMTNLALEPEFELASTVVSRLGLTPEQLSIVPGNHDVYTRGAQRDQRFVRYFGRYITSDIDVGDAAGHPSGPFPFVRLRGEAAIIGLSTAVARIPLIASGHAGERQLQLVANVLEHPEVRARTPVVLIHHPLINPKGFMGALRRGLPEAARIRAILRRRHELVVLHGHLHGRAHHRLLFDQGVVLHQLGATSASLVHPKADRMAGYNLYQIGPGGLESVTARVYDPHRGVFVNGTVHQYDTIVTG